MVRESIEEVRCGERRGRREREKKGRRRGGREETKERRSNPRHDQSVLLS